MSKLTIVKFNAQQAKAHIQEFVDTYLDVYSDRLDEFFAEDRYRKQLDSHLQAPNWTMVCAYHSNDLVGYIYGFTLRSNTAWWNGLLYEATPDFTRETGRGRLLLVSSW
jgi:hypothetical protein